MAMAMDDSPFFDDFPSKISIYRRFPAAMFDHRRVKMFPRCILYRSFIDKPQNLQSFPYKNSVVFAKRTWYWVSSSVSSSEWTSTLPWLPGFLVLGWGT
jgi:hypothetical protein